MSTAVDHSAASAPPVRTWRTWWRDLPGYWRILFRAFMIVFVLHLVLIVRILIGLQEPKEITEFRRMGGMIYSSTDDFKVPVFAARIPGAQNPNVLWFLATVMKGLRGRTCKDVEQVTFMNRSVTNEHIQFACDHFPRMFAFSCYGCELTGSLEPLVDCPQLRCVVFRDMDLTDDDISPLAGLNSLVDIALFGTTITDKSLPVLQSMPSLKRIDVRITHVTRTGMTSFLASSTSSLRILSDYDHLPQGIRGVVCWSDGAMTTTTRGSNSCKVEKMRRSNQSLDQAWIGSTLLTGNLFWIFREICIDDRVDGEYRFTLTLGNITSEPVTLSVTDGVPSVDRIEFRMPVTRAEALRIPRQ